MRTHLFKKIKTVFFILLSLASIDAAKTANSPICPPGQFETGEDAEFLARIQGLLRLIPGNENDTAEKAVTYPLPHGLIKPTPIRPTPTIVKKTVSFTDSVKISVIPSNTDCDNDTRALQAQLHTDWIAVHQAVMSKKEAVVIDILNQTLAKCSLEYRREFLNLSDKVNKRANPTGRTLLHWAIAQQGKYHLVNALISLGAAAGFDPNINDIYGQTPLDMVLSIGPKRTSKYDTINIVWSLLNAKANPTKHFTRKTPATNPKKTPLHLAVQTGWLEAARLLVQQILLDGGKELLMNALSAQDNTGRTPYDYAQDKPAIKALFDLSMQNHIDTH